jgi:Pvc16 N-terminal domain
MQPGRGHERRVMSNSLAIASVTATLQAILQQGIILESDLTDATVTIQSLDKARGSNTNNQLNLFLYMVVRNAAWVTADMPRQVLPGEIGYPPLPLNLYYLMTAFGRDDDTTQPFGHELLGKAMSILHDHAVLRPADISAATLGLLPASDLAQQLERLRITFHPLSLDELAKLWTGFSMQYRLSAAYEVSVTLISSTLSTRTPLPTLTRGPQDQGFNAQANLIPPLPTLSAVTPPNRQSSAHLNDIVALTGFNLDGTNVGIQFDHELWAEPVVLTPEPNNTSTSVSVQIPNQPTVWPAGFYTVALLVQRPGENFQRTTNSLSLTLAPTISVAPASAPAGAITYTVTISPDVFPTQSPALLLNDNEFTTAPITVQSGTLTFATTGLTAGDYWTRLRVDGVDSLLVDRTKTPPVFDSTQKVTVT